MAQTWTAYYAGVAFAAGKNMAGILNADAAEILRIRRVGLLNAQTIAIGGSVCQLELRRYTGATLPGGTAIVPVSHDTTNVAPATATYSHNSAPAGVSSVLRRVFWSSDEAAINTGTIDEIETFVPLNIIWDAGYGDANVQALALREDESIIVYNTTGAVGLLDTWIEFTKE